MRSEKEIRDLLRRAQSQTSAQAASISLIVPAENNHWIVLLKSRGEELAFQVSDHEEMSDDQILAQLVTQLKRLF